MGSPKDGILVELDERRRVTLGRIARHDRYLAHEEPDGTIVMTPAVVMLVSDLNRRKKAAKPAPAADPEPVPEPSPVTTSSAASLREQILALVRAAGPGGIRATAIVKGVTGARSTTFGELSKLREAGYVKKNPAGRYEPISARGRKAS